MNRPSSGVNEDMSDDAIRARYDKANRLSIIICDRVIFASLSDINYLLNQNNELQKQIIRLESKLVVLDSKGEEIK